MKKILIIPHHPGLEKIKIRLIEIAKALSQDYEVYLVNWTVAQETHSIWERITSALKDAFATAKSYKKDNINVIEFPILHRPLKLAAFLNSHWLKKAISSVKPDILINGSFYMFNINKKRDFKYIFDVADLPVEETNNYFDRFVYKQTAEEIKKADIVTVCSGGLKNYVRDRFSKEAIFVPNGAEIERLRLVNDAEVEKIRQEHNLFGKWVIGYIGHIGEWVNVDLAVEAFHQIESEMPDAVLLWVGLSGNIHDLRKKYAKENIIFTGGVYDVDPYFKLLNLGLLPHRKCLFQDMAFHIKLIEYTAVRKFVVCTPLREMTSLNLPNVIFADESARTWAQAIIKARALVWQKDWDSSVEEFDWKNIVQKVKNLI
ncbi:MAG: glycosyltransferase [Candidatus Omnitrophica bacterium]|nr:glycosyltransferase [Candidatus Omnitrophota bacterium]